MVRPEAELAESRVALRGERLVGTREGSLEETPEVQEAVTAAEWLGAVTAVESLAVESLAAEWLAAESLAAESLAAEWLAAESLAAEWLAAESLAAEWLAVESVAASSEVALPVGGLVALAEARSEAVAPRPAARLAVGSMEAPVGGPASVEAPLAEHLRAFPLPCGSSRPRPSPESLRAPVASTSPSS